PIYLLLQLGGEVRGDYDRQLIFSVKYQFPGFLFRCFIDNGEGLGFFQSPINAFGDLIPVLIYPKYRDLGVIDGSKGTVLDQGNGDYQDNGHNKKDGHTPYVPDQEQCFL